MPRILTGPRKWNADARARIRDVLHTARTHKAIGPTDIAALQNGTVCLLNQPVPIREGIPWDETRFGRLWQYNLHYCRFVRDGVVAGVLDAPTAKRWLEDWVARNPPGADVAWDPFCVAARLINWPFALVDVDDIGDVLRQSYALQRAFLRQNLEWDVQANHLHKNAAALVLADALIDGQPAPGDLALLRGQLDEQVKRDGGHYERSAMYHQHVLEDTVIAAIAGGNHTKSLLPDVARMADYLAGMIHMDGTIPLFGDAVQGDAMEPRAMLAWIDALTGRTRKAPVLPRAFPDTGFYWMGSPETLHGVVTAGEANPPYQPGHAHGDPLSYELFAGDRAFVVDTGVHGYADSPYRAHCRGAAAHNITRPCGAEPLELWGAFRAGRRYALKVEKWEAGGAVQILTASHDGYRPVKTRREFRFHADGVLLVSDTFQSATSLSLESYVHLHPDVAIKPDDCAFVLRCGAESLVMLLEDDVDARLAAGTAADPLGYQFPRFGVIESTHCIVLTKRAAHLHYAYVCGDNVAHARKLLRATLGTTLGRHDD